VCRLPNAKGRLVTVTSASAFGRVLTDIDLTLDPKTRDVTGVVAVNRLVDRREPPPDPTVAGIVKGYEALVAPRAAVVIGSIAVELPNAAVDAACNMPAGDLIADAQLAATRAPELGGAQIALMNRGGVRTPGFTFQQRGSEGDGNVTYGEAFTVQPFGNSLVTLTLTTQQIKELLEQQFAGCAGQLATATRLLLPSAGFHVRWDGARGCGARIREVTLTQGGRTEALVDAQGQVVGPDRRWRVTVNSFLAAGGDGFSVLTRGRAPLGGAQDIDALAAYLGRFKAPAPPYRPGTDPADRGRPRLQRDGGSTCPTGAQTNP
jgi:5'-nucleotidase